MTANETLPSTVIGPDIKIVGNIEALADLMIEGNVEGDVHCRTLILGEHGEIRGKILSNRALVSGKIDGSIDTQDLSLEATGILIGKATYARLKVSTGAMIDGILKNKKETKNSKGSDRPAKIVTELDPHNDSHTRR